MAPIDFSAKELQEVRHHLAEHLTRPDLAAMTRVCKSWHGSFTPFLYREILFTATKMYGANPSVETIEANANYIHAVLIYEEHLYHPLEALTKLESICFRGFGGVKNPETWTRLGTLLRQNPELQTLTVTVSGEGDHMHGFMEALASSCPKLHTLVMDFQSLDGECTRLLLDTAVRLEVLSIFECDLVSPDTMERWPVFANIQNLSFRPRQPVERYLEILRRCPQLKSLTCLVGDGLWISEFSEVIAAHCPHLESLDIGRQDVRHRWSDVSSILDSCRKLTKFTMNHTDLDGFNFQRSLNRHFSYLTHLDLYGCRTVTSPTVQQVMTSCPRLEYLQAESLDACDILGIAMADTSDAGDESNGGQQEDNRVIHPQEWVCTGLRTLSLYIRGLMNEPDEWQREVLRQLSRLTRLEVLRVGDYDGPSEDGLDLTLGSGLGILSSLNLRELDFTGVRQEMDENDVKWILEAWPRLSHLLGELHHDYQRRYELQCILRRRGLLYTIDM
ncbi:hypothetical protein B0O80DRAFT_458802 [Mortierella sp. GBAus27b]|nr:hypothetical protein B0O80DRAFT_458802 [Mortierella sp. GBAus27b]